MTLDVAIATYRPEGIQRVTQMQLPSVEGVRYVVSWQEHGDTPVPESLRRRDDVKIYRFGKSGQSLNRNNAMDHCTADIILHGDDDLVYTPEGLSGVIRTFQDNPDIDIAAFRSDRVPPKVYPSVATKLGRKLPRGYFASMIEIAVRRSTAGSLRCCPELGLASPRMHGGEDEMFLQSAIRRGLTCLFVPLTVCSHPAPSTGTKGAYTPANMRASGCTIALTYGGWESLLRVPLKAWRLARSGRARLLPALYYTAQGAIESKSLHRRNRETLW